MASHTTINHVCEKFKGKLQMICEKIKGILLMV